MSQPTDASILTHFAQLDDPRDKRGKDHHLLDIVAIAICAVICGADSWVDIELYGQSKQEWLGVVLQKVVEDRKLLEKGIGYATTPKISATCDSLARNQF